MKKINSNGTTFYGTLFEDRVVVSGSHNRFENCTFDKGITFMDSEGGGNYLVSCLCKGTVSVGEHNPRMNITHEIVTR